MAAFAEADNFVIAKMTELAEKAGLPIEVVVRDSQSNANRAADVARELIVNDGIALLVAASTPETTNPVATVAEVEEFPCITTYGSSIYVNYLLVMRIKLAQHLLQNTGDSIAEIAFACGFSHQEHLTRMFRRWCDTTPATFRKATRN